MTIKNIIIQIIQILLIGTIIYISITSFEEFNTIEKTIRKTSRALDKLEDRHAKIIKHALDISETTFQEIQFQKQIEYDHSKSFNTKNN